MPPAATPILTCSSLSARPGTRCARLTRPNESAASALCKSSAWPLENGVTDGVWGGATEDERRAIRSLSRRKKTNKEVSDGETYRPARHGEHGIRAQSAPARATWIFRDAGIGPGAGG